MNSDQWDRYSLAEWQQLARAWYAENRVVAASDDSVTDDRQEEGRSIGETVALMNFTAPPEKQLEFIQIAYDAAADDFDLGHLAAGPVEHVLAHHFDGGFPIIAAMAARDPRFRQMLTGVWQHKMTDQQFAKLEALRAA